MFVFYLRSMNNIPFKSRNYYLIVFQKQSKGGFLVEAGVRNRVSGEIEAIKADEIMAEVKMRGT